MLKDIHLPEISENVESGEVVHILVSSGEHIAKDQPIMELETDKAGFELPSPEEGTVAEVEVREGDTVRVGQVLMKVETDGVAGKTGQPEQAQEAPPAEEPEPQRTEPEQPEPPQQAAPPSREAPSRQKPTAPSKEAPSPVAAEPSPASPSVRRQARELGIDIRRIEGTGPRGRITPDDVKRTVKEALSAQAREETGPAPAAQAELLDFSQWGTTRREPMSNVRRLTAESMATSWATIPQVTQFDRADITELESYRRAFDDKAEKSGVKLSITAIVVKVVASALSAFPRVNASVDMQRREIIYKEYVNIGVAVDTDRGLLVPVLQNADTKNVLQIARIVADLARRARDKQIMPDELSGGNFTVSNLGGIGGTGFAPIVYHPQAAILGVARAREECVFVEGEPRARTMLPLSLSYDHRIVDGAEGARFMHWIVEALENPFLVGLEGGH